MEADGLWEVGLLGLGRLGDMYTCAFTHGHALAPTPETHIHSHIQTHSLANMPSRTLSHTNPCKHTQKSIIPSHILSSVIANHMLLGLDLDAQAFL